MGTKRALLVGIDDYPGCPLKGCVADATEMAARLRTNADGSPNFAIRLLTSPTQIDRETLRGRLEELFDHRHQSQLRCATGR
jgi:hypothetical protein